MDKKKTGTSSAELDNISGSNEAQPQGGSTSPRNRKKNVDISIIIPARNEEGNIGKCLQAIYEQDTPYTFEIIVIDSGSTDKTAAIAGSFPRVRLLKIEPHEFAHGKTRNLGAGKSKGDYIVFLNADAGPIDTNWLTPLIESLKNDKQAAGVYSRHIPRQDCHLYMARDLLAAMPPQPSVRSSTGGFDFMIFSTVSAAVKREIWEKHPFDDHIIIAEDQDWAKKVLHQGYKIIYEPASMVYHSHNFSPRELFVIKAKIGRTEKKFKNKFLALTAGFFLVLGGIFVKFCADIFFILFKSKRALAAASKINKSFVGVQGVAFQKNPLLAEGKNKIKQIGIAAAARVVGFAGRYVGWLGAKNG
ncbi:MAG: glycosyltransferase [Candidatus Aminicenantes bacterium]|nr:glycosyltransferase [Candidatus Aminicenantes bacterium]